MELYLAATGVKHELDYVLEQLQFQVMALPIKTKEGKDVIQPIYANLQPIQLYRYVFPKEYLDQIVKMLGIEENRYKKFDKQAFLMRKILNAKPIPKPKEGTKIRFFNKGNVGLIGIGIKEDEEVTDELGHTFEGI